LSEPSSVRRRKWWKLFLAFCVFSLVVLASLAWYVTTDSFQQMVRRRVIAALEETTGGRVEVGAFHTIPLRLRVDVRDLVVHGREGADQAPFFHVDRLQAELKIVSLLSRTVRLHSLLLEHPVTHIVVYPDGSTNAPAPRVTRTLGKGPIEDLVSLAVSRIEVQRGEVLWEHERIPLDLTARDVALQLRYSFLRQRYQGDLSVGNARTQFRQYPPVEWRASASVILARDHAEISELKATSGRSEVHFSGNIRGFHQPQVSGQYRGAIDLADLAAFLRQPALKKGVAHFEGKGSWSEQDFTTQGAIAARDVEWSDVQLRTQNGRLNARFSVTPQRLQISSVKAGLFGGELQGEVDVNNWQVSLAQGPSGRRQVAGRVPVETPQRGTLRLQLTGFPLAPAIAVLSTNKVPLKQLNLTGAVSGNVDMVWAGAIRDAEARATLHLVAPGEPQPGLLPVRGEVAGVYRGSHDELQLDRFQIDTPASEISASGNLSDSSELKFSFNSHHVNEWKPLLQAAYGSDHLPFTVHGWAKFDGTASGRLSALALNGKLEVYDFDTELPLNDRQPAHVVHWDAITAGVQYSSGTLAAHDGVLIHGPSVARFDGSLALVQGIAQPNSPFTLRLDVRDAEVAEVAELSGLRYPLAGAANISLHAFGTRLHPQGEGRIEVRDARVYDTPIPSARSNLRLSEKELQFNHIEASVYGAALSGNVAVSLTDHQFRSSLAGKNLDLARVPRWQSSRFALDGHADFTARVSGTVEQPSLEAHVHVRDLAFDKERVGDFYVDAATRGRQLELQAHSDFEQADLKVRGTVGMEDKYPSDLDIGFQNFDIDSLLNAYLPGKTTGHSKLAGTIRLHGPLRSPRDLSVTGILDSVDVEIAHVSLHNEEPVRFDIADQVLRVENMHLAGKGTDFVAHGKAQLSTPGEMDFQLNGTVGMELLQTLNPKVSARGTTNVSLNIGGIRSKPVFQGKLEVKDMFVSHEDFPSGLSNLNGVLSFDQNRIQIEKLNGSAGGGTIALTGSATYEKGAVLLDLGARARDVRLRYPPGVSSTANANLRLTGSTSSALLSGTVVVTKLGVTPGFDLAAYAEKSKRSVVSAGSDNLESHLKLDVHVVTAPELQMQTAIAKLSGSADLRLRGTADRPVVTGRATANEGGQLSFNGTKYNVERMEVTFSNPAKTQPVIDIRATTRVRDYDITVTISGDLSVPNSLKPTWHSEPPLPEADVINLLALGRTTEESAALGNGSTGLGGQANLLLNQALNTAVTSRMQRLFGVSRIKIDPQGLSSETNVVHGPQVTIEQQLASNLTVTYSTNVSVASQQIIQAEYNLTRNVSIVALRDQNGVVSFDLKIRQRKK
jgi:translocation and assembly module TamB